MKRETETLIEELAQAEARPAPAPLPTPAPRAHKHPLLVFGPARAAAVKTVRAPSGAPSKEPRR